MNALAYAKSLKAMTLQRPQVQVLDDAIGAVTQGADGSIESLILRSGASLTADLYIDCTGSRAMLLHALDEPWVSAHERLFVDGAWLIQLPYRDRSTQLRNTTYCHALSSGWVFNIPLQSRIGTGYIFSSSHQSDDAAAREFALHLQKHYGYEPASLSFRRLRFATGYRKQQWVKNVIGVGMSSFFCEPLESTAIAMANSTALCLREALQNQHVSVELLRDRLNRSQRQLAQSVLEFVEMHYTLSKRSDSSFWRDYQAKGLTEHQRAWIERYSHAPGGKRFELADIKQVFGEFGMFCNLSYAMMFYGYGIKPAARHQALTP
jgi:flavin-dependent dehydrogenase